MRRFLAGFTLGLTLLPLLIVVLLFTGSFAIGAADQPPDWEGRLARWAIDRRFARRTERLANPVPASAPELLAGMRFYRNGCAGCHGGGKAPSDWGTHSFYPRAPQFGRVPPSRPDWQLFSVVKFGIRYSGMGGWEKLASDREIWQAVTFLSHLRSLPPEIASEWRKPPP